MQTPMSTAKARGRFFSLKRLVVIAAVVGLGWAIYEGASRWRLSQLFGGLDRIALLREATEVTAWRLTPPMNSQPGLQQIPPEEFQLAGDAVELPRGTAYELQQLLASPASYRFFSLIVAECGQPDYGVKFSFVREGEAVDVYVCFKCRELAVMRSDGTNGEADFTPSGSKLIAIVQELFPGDAEIMALK
jgi:hypothetical protein